MICGAKIWITTGRRNFECCCRRHRNFSIWMLQTKRPDAIWTGQSQNIRSRTRATTHWRLYSALKKRQLLEETKKLQERAYRLTLLGEHYLARKNVSPPLILPNGLQTIVSFDIPEQHRRARDALRRYLKYLGFQRLHWSVWFSDRDWLERLTDQIKNSKTDNWVSIIQGRIK